MKLFCFRLQLFQSEYISSDQIQNIKRTQKFKLKYLDISACCLTPFCDVKGDVKGEVKGGVHGYGFRLQARNFHLCGHLFNNSVFLLIRCSPMRMWNLDMLVNTQRCRDI